MFKEIYNKIFKTNGANYDANGKQGFSSSGSSEPDQLTEEPNGYEANANTAGIVNVDGGKNIDRDAHTIERDIQDWQTGATQDLLGNPQTVRPVKNSFRNVDAELSNKYFGNMEKR